MLNILEARTDSSDNEIARYLSQTTGLDYDQSIAEGSNDQQLIDYFVSTGHASYDPPEAPPTQSIEEPDAESYTGAFPKGAGGSSRLI